MDSGRYTRVKARFWASAAEHGWDDDTRMLALYLLTCPHNNILGAFVLPRGYASADLGWEESPARLSNAWAALEADDFIRCEARTRLVVITHHLEHNPLENPNQVTAAMKQLNELPNSQLLETLRQAVAVKATQKAFLLPLVAAIEAHLPIPLATVEPAELASYTPFQADRERLPEPLAEPYRQPVTVIATITAAAESPQDAGVREAPEEEPFVRPVPELSVLANLPAANQVHCWQHAISGKPLVALGFNDLAQLREFERRVQALAAIAVAQGSTLEEMLDTHFDLEKREMLAHAGTPMFSIDKEVRFLMRVEGPKTRKGHGDERGDAANRAVGGRAGTGTGKGVSRQHGGRRAAHPADANWQGDNGGWDALDSAAGGGAGVSPGAAAHGAAGGPPA